jgi:RimJ/RimL family protein N-acetyltransferase/catechol 2,3-dioxygenase-like lactoylglutathione lyase family enzyme
VILETERLRLRPFRADDLEAYVRLVGDAHVMRFIADGAPLSREDAWRNLAMILGHWALRGFGLWAAEERATGALIGRIGFFEPEGWPGFEVGWLLARSHQGRGLATEGARAALDFAFLALGRVRVISLIHLDNAPSIRVAERIGETFERTGDLGGRPVAIYAIERSAWAAVRPAGASAVPWVGAAASEGAARPRTAGSPPEPKRPVPLEVNGLDHLYLTVADLARSIAFYDPIMRALGFFKGTGAIGGAPHVHYYNRWLQISLRPASPGAPRHDAYAPGLHHVCLRLDGVAEVRAAVALLRGLGVDVGEPRLYPEYAPDYFAAFFSDPDGLRLELVAMRSRRLAVRARWRDLDGFENPFDRLPPNR